MKRQKTNIFKENYDKFLVGIVLTILIVSLCFLIAKSKESKTSDTKYAKEMNSLESKVANKAAEVFDVTFLVDAEKKAANPQMLATGTNSVSLLVAEDRVACIKCFRPIPFNAEKCIFCDEAQPSEEEDESWDSDGDGMPDSWERAYGLNPADPSDADLDSDGDGFTNLEEFKANTDPRSAESHPPREKFLVIRNIDAKKFPYTLKGGTGLKLQFNDVTGKTTFKGENEVLPGTQFKITKITSKKGVLKRKGLPDKEVMLKVAHLTDGLREIVLDQGGAPVWSEQVVTFVCTRDKSQKEYVAKEFESFIFDNQEYKIKSVDKNTQIVVLINKVTQQELIVRAE